MKKLILNLAFLSLTSLCFAQKLKDFDKAPTLVRELKAKKNTRLADSIAQDYINNYLFKLKKVALMSQDNLFFISQNLGDTNCKGFKFFVNNRDKINAILGKDKAEYAIRYAIAREFIPIGNNWKKSEDEWGLLEKKITSRFGQLGAEVAYGRRMEYASRIKDWNNYSKYYKLYFETAFKRPEWNINNLSYELFLNTNDPKILFFASDVVMKYAMEEWYQEDFTAYDTYANLLYKTGRRDQAIKWEERALKLSNNSKEVIENLNKMKRNEKTWVEKIDRN